MVSTTGKKRGRPQGRHRMRDGTEIQGLTRRADGRWKISATGQTFVEPDENLAVARFREDEARRNATANLGTLKVHTSAEDALIDVMERTIAAGGSLTTTSAMSEDRRVFAISDETLSPQQWAWLRRKIIKEPRWVAERVGIEQVGYLTDLKQPEVSPTLEALIEVYAAKPGITKEEVTRCRKFWAEFAEIVGIRTIRELEHEHVEVYERRIGEMDLAPKSVKHRYSRIRTVLAYALRRGKAPVDCRRALDKLAMLEVEGVHSLDPNPIVPADFWAIHAAAAKENATYAAMMLFALNAALYSSEVGAVRWDDVDLDRAEYATRRNKTKVPRVACLWPETVEALAALPRDRGTVFNTRVQAYTRFSVHRNWTAYREAAEVKGSVTFAMIRDAAFTTACRRSLDQARILAGHRLPGAVDHYVLRNPQFVGGACQAVHDQFFAKRPAEQSG